MRQPGTSVFSRLYPLANRHSLSKFQVSQCSRLNQLFHLHGIRESQAACKASRTWYDWVSLMYEQRYVEFYTFLKIRGKSELNFKDLSLINLLPGCGLCKRVDRAAIRETCQKVCRSNSHIIWAGWPGKAIAPWMTRAANKSEMSLYIVNRGVTVDFRVFDFYTLTSGYSWLA